MDRETSALNRTVRLVKTVGASMGLLAVTALSGLTVPAVADEGKARLTGLRSSATEVRSRLVFQLDAPVEHQIFTLENPHRVVIDIKRTERVGKIPETVPVSPWIKRVRHAPRNGDDLRVVLDLTRQVRPKSFLLEPQGRYGHRLVVDLRPANAARVARRERPRPEQRSSHTDEPRDLVIAIDPGHGGKDPGAVGPNGTYEKDIVLEIAKRLRAMIANTPGYTPVMTRSQDKYLSLRDRIRIARNARADMFISLHADAFPDHRATGSSVYALSLNGASSEAARRLARRENSADLIGGVSLEDKDKMLASVLLDLSQTATIESSLKAGEQVLGELGRVNDLHKHSVQQAGFVVLKAPDVPSILVETAFISNPEEARELKRTAHQRALADAIRDGIKAHFRNQAPPGTQIYARNHASSG